MEWDFHLRRTELDQNIDRFYNISLTYSLLGMPGVMRTWGRLGAWGQTRLDWYDEELEARLAISKLLLQKQKKGYLLA